MIIMALSGFKRRATSSTTSTLVQILPNNARNHFVAMTGEFVGTFLFLFFAFSAAQVANTPPPPPGSHPNPNPSALLYIALVFGFSLGVNAWIFFRISGGLFNPAVRTSHPCFALLRCINCISQVTLALCLIGAVPARRGALVFVAQLLGGIAAAGVVSALFPGPLPVAVRLGGGTSIAQGLFIEMFLTAELIFTIIMLAAKKHKSTFIAPVGIGLSLLICHLTGMARIICSSEYFKLRRTMGVLYWRRYQPCSCLRS
jgi:aquaporin related protein